MIHLLRFAGQSVFSGDAPFLGSYWRGHLAVRIRPDQVSGCVDVFGRGAKFIVDLDKDTLIHSTPGSSRRRS